jgi:DDE superfamily endonuclease
MDPHVIACFASHAQNALRCTSTLDGAIGTALGTEPVPHRLGGSRGTEPRQRPPFCHDGTERRIQRPKDPDQQTSHYSGKKKCHTVKNVVLVDKKLTIQFLSPTHPGTVHDKRIADATPYPLPQGSHLLQDLGFLAFTLEGVIIQMPTKKPRGGELTAEQKAVNQALACRRVAIEHVNSSIKRCRILKDVCRLLRSGVRDQIMEICCALHNFRLRLDPWLPMS